MFEFTLLKSLFFEMDKYEMEGVKERKSGKSTFRRLEVSYESVPEITCIISEERILPMVDRYYLYVNDEKQPVDPKEMPYKQVIYEFFKDHFPHYLKADLPEDMTDVNILEAFEVWKMPDYRPKLAFPDIVTLEDIRNGNVRDDDKPKHSFPGLEFLGGYKKEDPDAPTWSTFEGYTEFQGDQKAAQNKIDLMKQQFAHELADLPIDLDALGGSKLVEFPVEEESSAGNEE